MNRAYRVLTAALVSLAVPSAALANDFMFSQASVVVVGPTFLLWMVGGMILYSMKKRLRWFSWGGLLLFLMTLYIGHPEILLIFWMIYVALLTAHYAFSRRAKNDPGRKLNLVFHGSFLILIIVGGVIAKTLYYSQIGGFSRWSAAMREIFPGFAVAFCFIFFLCWGFFNRGILLKRDGPSAEAVHAAEDRGSK